VGVILLPHAVERLRERFPNKSRKKMRCKIQRRIMTELRKGVRLSHGAIRVMVEPGIWAVCVPDVRGWKVITIFREEERNEI